MANKPLTPSQGAGAATRAGRFDPFGQMRREMERLFEDFGRGLPSAFPSFADTGFLNPTVEVTETDKGLEVSAELPGIAENDIDVELHDDVLTIKAERRQEKDEEDKDKRYHISERAYGTYLRRFALPFEADPDKVEAKFDNGVLRIVVPRSAEAPPRSRKIRIG